MFPWLQSLSLSVQVKAQYNVLLDSIKQTSLQNLQGDVDTPMETVSGQVRTQQALSLHKVDMDASVMEVRHATINNQ